MAATGANVVQNVSSLSKLQSLNGICAIYKKCGPTSADVLNSFKEKLLKGRQPCMRLFIATHTVS